MTSLNDNPHPLARLLKTTWGALAVIVAAALIGWSGAVFLSGVPSAETAADLEARVDALEGRAGALSDSIQGLSDDLVWVICTSVPPNRADVLAALRVSCEYDSATRKTIRGIPVLEEDEE